MGVWFDSSKWKAFTIPFIVSIVKFRLGTDSYLATICPASWEDFKSFPSDTVKHEFSTIPSSASLQRPVSDDLIS